jgi:hypothetical protein
LNCGTIVPYSSMVIYKVVDHYRIGIEGAEVCVIERALPREKPVRIRFRGSWLKAQAEANRLNALVAVMTG